MFWAKKEKTEAQAKPMDKKQAACCGTAHACPRCGYPVEGMVLVCPRCREELPRGCSGNCSGCGK